MEKELIIKLLESRADMWKNHYENNVYGDKAWGAWKACESATNLVRRLTIPVVNQQTDLLAFRQWQKDNWDDVYLYSDELMILEFKKANCV